MKAQLTIGQLFGIVPVMQELVNTPVPALTAYRLKKAADAINAEVKAAQEIVEATRERLKEDSDQLHQEIEALLEETVELDVTRIEIRDLGDARIRAADIMALSWLFEGIED